MDRPTTAAAATPVLDRLERMTTDSLEASGLGAPPLMLVRLAAPPASDLPHLGAAGAGGGEAATVRAVRAAVAPIGGTARTVSALGKLARALGLALDLVAMGEDDEDGEEEQARGPAREGPSRHPNATGHNRPTARRFAVFVVVGESGQ